MSVPEASIDHAVRTLSERDEPSTFPMAGMVEAQEEKR